ALPEQARGAAQLAVGAAEARQVPADGRARPDDQPAHAAAQLRDAPAGQRGGPAQRAGAARAPVAEHDAGVHAPDDAADARRLPPGAPAGRGGLIRLVREARAGAERGLEPRRPLARVRAVDPRDAADAAVPP